MIKLRRMLLIHWQAYEFQLVDFNRITLITGQTAAGKSTVIDALNVILLGEKQKHIFNKAANENSDRTLDSYLYGKLGDDGEEGFFYLREDNFTSYLVAEFENEETSELFCCGFVADCSSDFNHHAQWLTIDSGLPADYFLNEAQQIPYSISELIHQNNLKDASEKVNLIATDKDYRKTIAGLFGQIRDDYRRLLKQSVSFTPVKDIEKFLVDFVSETETSIDVKEMQSSVRRYNDLEKESARIRKKVDRLEVIKKELKRLGDRRFIELRQDYYIEKAKLENFQEMERKYQNEVHEKSEKIENNKLEWERLFQRGKLLKEEKEQLQRKRDSLTVLKDKVVIENQIETKNEQIKNVQKYTDSSLEIIKLTGQFVQELGNVPRNVVVTSYLTDKFFQYQKENDLVCNFFEVNELMGEVIDKLNQYQYSISAKKNDLESKHSSLLNEKITLEKGIKSVPDQIGNFKKELQSYLRKYDSDAKVEYLADVIDFKDGEEKWQKAIEAYIGSQRYYLVMDPRLYSRALRFYQSIQKQKEVYGVGLINFEKLKNKSFKADINSLASKLTTDNKLVRLYIYFLLGRVIACDDIMALSNYHTSITADGFLYKGFVTRKLQFGNLRMSIGSIAIERQLQNVNQAIKDLEENLSELQEEQKILAQFDKYQKRDSYSCKTVVEYGDKAQLNQKLKELESLERQLDQLDDSELIALEDKINNIAGEATQIEVQMNLTHKDSDDLRLKINQIKQELLPQCYKQIMVQETIFQSKFSSNEHLSLFEEAYRSAINKLDSLVYEDFISNYINNQKQTRIGINELEDTIKDFMFKYNQEFTEDLPINLEQSFIYKEEYDKYIHSELPKFELDITDARKKAINEFRYEFLGRLKSNIENLTRQVDEINEALKNRKFGEDIYRFTIKPAVAYKEYYDMIMDEMLMDQGEWNLLSTAFESKYAKQIELLFNILSGDDLNEETTKESRIQIFSDYKSYLSFDMTIRKGDDAKPQRLSKTYTSKSGGETQIPLYISLLAAFSQVYRVLNVRRNNTMRLIIMDEAFNKIDGEKIKQCIQLIREFGLQAIFSTPPEKIAEIMEEADKALVVFRNQNQTTLREFSSLNDLAGEPYEI